jgi:hypothetical protein
VSSYINCFLFIMLSKSPICHHRRTIRVHKYVHVRHYWIRVKFPSLIMMVLLRLDPAPNCNTGPVPYEIDNDVVDRPGRHFRSGVRYEFVHAACTRVRCSGVLEIFQRMLSTFFFFHVNRTFPTRITLRYAVTEYPSRLQILLWFWIYTAIELYV